MKTIYLIISLVVVATACSKSDNDKIDAKKKELADARKEYQALKEKITKIEDELKTIDPQYAKETDKAVQVSTLTPEKGLFNHRFDVRGTVESRRNVSISAQMPGIIERVHVVEGQVVSKGQLLVAVDSDITQNSIKEVKSQLELAQTVYERQAKLWEQKIGTEVQYLQAKANKEALESRLGTLNAQLEQSSVRAPFSGTVDHVFAREGEMASPGVPLVRVASPEEMYIRAEISERFLGKVSKGDLVEIFLPIQDKTIQSKVASVSQVINPDNRTFSVEVGLPKSDVVLKPNMVTVVKLSDYSRADAVTIPTRLILRDNEGEFVYGVEKKDNQTVAKKVRVTSGVSYQGQTEILEGLTGAEQLIDKGFRDVTEGVHVAVVKGAEISKVAQN